MPHPRLFARALPLTLAAALAAGASKESDVLLLRAGGVERGRLEACVGDVCRLAGRPFRRDDIAWIGLAVAPGVAPPPISQLREDEVHLVDGSVEVAHLVGISLGEVVTTATTREREQVAWIHLAGPGDERIPAVEAEPTPTPTPTPRGQAIVPCPPGRPLGGRVAVTTDLEANGCAGSMKTELRFPLVDNAPASTPWPGRVWTGWSAPWLDYVASSGGCSGSTPNHGESCHAPGGTKSGRAILGSSGPLGFQSAAGAEGYLHFRPALPEITASVLPDEIHTSFTTPLECVGPHTSSKGNWGVGLAGFDIRPAGPNCPADDPFVACVAGTECASPADEATRRDCMLHADRHALVPFRGERTWRASSVSRSGGFTGTKIEWEICCGCGPASTASAPTGHR